MNFNTSHVNVNPREPSDRQKERKNFNTSHVNVNLNTDNTEDIANDFNTSHVNVNPNDFKPFSITLKSLFAYFKPFPQKLPAN